MHSSSQVELLERRAYFAAAPTGPTDLAVFVGGVPTATVAGPKAKTRVTAIVSNEGSNTFAGDVAVRIVASTDAIVALGDFQLARVTKRLKIAPGAVKPVTFKVAAVDVPDNNYFLIAEIAPAGSFPDAVAENNFGPSFNKTTIAAPFFELEAQYFSTPLTIERGIRGESRIQVRNLGTAPFSGTVTFDMLLLPDDVTLPNQEMEDTTLTLKLKPGQKKLVKALVYTTAPIGNYSHSTLMTGFTDRNPDNDEAVIGVEVADFAFGL